MADCSDCNETPANFWCLENNRFHLLLCWDCLVRLINKNSFDRVPEKLYVEKL